VGGKVKEMPPGTPGTPGTPEEKKKGETVPLPKDKGQVSAPATLVVSLPADATLTVDGRPTVSTSATRVFVTPSLAADQQHHYTLTATVMRDGQPVSLTQRVPVIPGRQTSYNFDFGSTQTASNR